MYFQQPVNGFSKTVDSAVDCIEKFALSEGFSCKRFSFDKAADYIVIDANEGAEKGYIYIAHSDTVFGIGAFGDEVVKIADGKIYGPGVIDCKGGIAVALLSMKALCENGYKNHLRLIISSDEEVDNHLSDGKSVEILKIMSAGFKSAFCCEVGRMGEILVARSGIIRLTIDVQGRASHSGIDYFAGINAIQEAAHKIINIQQSSEKEGITYSCNLIAGGERINIVAPHCTFQVDIRVKCAEEKEKALAVVKKVVDTDYIGGTKSTLTIDSERMPMEKLDGNIALFEKIKKAANECHLEKIGDYCTSGGGSDAAYSVIAGVPTVCGIGTTGDFCHTVDEYADIDSLEKRAKLISQTILLS